MPMKQYGETYNSLFQFKYQRNVFVPKYTMRESNSRYRREKPVS